MTFRTFTPSSVIVVISTTGNVYSMEAIDELNLKRGHLKDLLNDVPFMRKDIITLQTPDDLNKFNVSRMLPRCQYLQKSCCVSLFIC